MFFEVAIRIISGRSTDQVQNLHCIRLGHALDHIVKLSLAGGDTLQTNLGLGLHKPCLNVVRPEGRQLNTNSIEKVGGGESGGNSLDDGWISRNIKQLEKKTTCSKPTYLYKSVKKTREAGQDILARFWQN